MRKYWIIIARRNGQPLELACNQIDTEIWDFVGSNSDESRTPSNALKLQKDDKVLFYISKEDRDGNPLSGYQYPIFFACATLASGFIKDGKFVSLKDVKHFKPPIPVIKPKDNYEIGARGPTMLVEIKDYQYEKVVQTLG